MARFAKTAMRHTEPTTKRNKPMPHHEQIANIVKNDPLFPGALAALKRGIPEPMRVLIEKAESELRDTPVRMVRNIA